MAAICFAALLCGCITPRVSVKQENSTVPTQFASGSDTSNIAKLNWKEYFSDENLIALIDTALKKNQELNITLQEIEISRNEVRARKGEYLPFVGLQAGAGIEKAGRFTRNGAVDENLEIKPGTRFPEPLNDYMFGLTASWEIDIWKKLRNAKKAAVVRYLASVEGKNFMVTNLIAEIANSYYELEALDNMLAIIEQNIEVQSNGLDVVKQQKQAAKVTQLAVNRFQAQLLNTKNLQFEIRQRIVETENRLHFLTGVFKGNIPRSSASFNDIALDSAYAGIPSQLLKYRPDIRQAELNLAAAKIDVKVARANFYPSFRIEGGAGFQAFNAAYLIKPESMLYNIAGELVAPLVNRNAIAAAYKSANAKQIQEVYNYERTILNAYLEVVNQLSSVDNFAKSHQTKAEEVNILMQSVTISNSLFNSARADYLEVLLTQQEALESKMELIEIKTKQLNAKVNIYKSLGGGWNF
ncbi:TolC family protein [Pseudochryseolinea flava]|uniref:TolC family protein n=2 Tax=Pseudochryseolinea flava TaxID=2059302 RepID=A0A364Y6F4_9BACT|nr:TolC family protein [Pseudochryseolinea flava]